MYYVHICLCLYINFYIYRLCTYILRNQLTQWAKICRMGQQAGDAGKSYSSHPKAICWQNSFLLRDVNLCNIKAFYILDEVTHIIETNVFTQSLLI